jgi:hypothetical protein
LGLKHLLQKVKFLGSIVDGTCGAKHTSNKLVCDFRIFGIKLFIFLAFLARLAKRPFSGDFRAYSAVNLHIGAVNNQIIPEAPSIVYENTKYNFTLKLPKSWEGKYEVVDTVSPSSNIESFGFIDKANKEAGWGGFVFSVSVWTKEDWIKNGPSAIEVGQIYKIGEDGDKVFTLSRSGDVEYDVHDEKLKAEYSSMSDQINKIKTTFKLNN